MTAVARRGAAGASLAEVASEVGVTKQAVLYHFPSKADLLIGAVDAAVEVTEAELRSVVVEGLRGWPMVEALVRRTFLLAARRPEVLALLRETARHGAPVSTHQAERLRPLIDEATGALERDMAAGLLRPRDTRVLLLSFHALIVGVAVDTEVMRAAGVAPNSRSLVRARRELLSLLGDALRPVSR
jgi:AcrR family transcriptional regulator